MAIKRRDFVSGFGMALAALGMTPLEAAARGLLDPLAIGPDYYPPALGGLRGSHAGSFEAAHAAALQGQRWPRPQALTDAPYDLVVVGGGISGLAAARFFRERAGAGARILVLDNHDDFGGHAKRNEFEVDGRRLIGYGGSQSIEGPATYSKEAAGLLRALGIEVGRFERYFDAGFSKRHRLGAKVWFDSAHYGVDRLVDDPQGTGWIGTEDATGAEREAIVRRMPIGKAAQDAFLRLLTDSADPLAGQTVAQKTAILRGMSYEDFLRRHAGMPEEVVLMLRNRMIGIWGIGYDALSAMEAVRDGMPGTAQLGFEPAVHGGGGEEEPYIYHFPDGNAAIARLLVRDLVPGSADGQTMEDMETARLRYHALDRPENAVRIRLNSTAVDVRHTAAGEAVEIVYLRGGAAQRVQARHVVLACYNHVIPHLCPELPAAQQEALRWPQKVPLVYANVALRNWRAVAAAGMFYFDAPQDFWSYGMVDFPVSMPGTTFSGGPDEPLLMHLMHAPSIPGLPPREQFRRGRQRLLGMRFEDYERELLRQLGAMLGPHGFDAARDVAAITVNRWPHGYTYEYIDLHDPADWTPENGPHIAGRQRLGRISIANADSNAYAYADAAIDAAWRAVSEQSDIA